MSGDAPRGGHPAWALGRGPGDNLIHPGARVQPIAGEPSAADAARRYLLVAGFELLLAREALPGRLDIRRLLAGVRRVLASLEGAA